MQIRLDDRSRHRSGSRKKEYLDVMKVRLPATKGRNPQHLRIGQSSDGAWQPKDASGWPLPNAA
jgi:hypothetical protein